MKQLFNVVVFGFIFLIHNLSYAESTCISDGQWFIPSNNQTLDTDTYLKQVKNKGIILLGEHHENRDHHVWQLNLIKHFFQKQKSMAIGLEMVPRRLQSVLDEWNTGRLTKKEFIEKIEWETIWAYNFEDYFPLFQFAKSNQIPLLAINVNKDLLKMVRQVGWENIPENHRDGIDNPATPSRDYVRQLAVSFQRHFSDPSKLTKEAFLRFVQQQQLWDRAMAETISKAKKEFELIVGLMGSWHIINLYGVPHQLTSLGATEIETLVPWDEHLQCEELTPKFASAIFGTTSKSNISNLNNTSVKKNPVHITNAD